MISYGTTQPVQPAQPRRNIFPNTLSITKVQRNIDDLGDNYTEYQYEDAGLRNEADLNDNNNDDHDLRNRLIMPVAENEGNEAPLFTAAPLRAPLKENDPVLLPLHTGRSFEITNVRGRSISKVLSSAKEKKTGLFGGVSHQLQIMRSNCDSKK